MSRFLTLLRSRQCAALDRAALAEGVSVSELMENAGFAVAQVVRHYFRPRPVLVLCGPGNNGGDGFVAARFLRRHGWPVRLAASCGVSALRGAAGAKARLWGLESIWSLHRHSPAWLCHRSGLVIDALFGAGLRSPMDGRIGEVLSFVEARGLPVVAVDLPSGLHGDSGQVLGEHCMRARHTVTFSCRKPGHLLNPGRRLCGRVHVRDIGIPDGAMSAIVPDVYENDPSLWGHLLRKRDLESHKHLFGHVSIAVGRERAGAAVLAAHAAYKAGAGVVALAPPCPDTASACIGALPSAVVRTARNGSEFARLQGPKRSVFLIGPGHGGGEHTRSFVRAASACKVPLVLDADALTCWEDPQDLFSLLHSDCLLTPHGGEFSRLFRHFRSDNLSTTLQAAMLSGAVVLRKGSDSVIAASDGRAMVSTHASPDLSVAGSGDVLAGIAAALMAQGLDAFAAGAAAAWIHGDASMQLGRGLLAQDLFCAIPTSMARASGDREHVSSSLFRAFPDTGST